MACWRFVDCVVDREHGVRPRTDGRGLLGGGGPVVGPLQVALRDLLSSALPLPCAVRGARDLSLVACLPLPGGWMGTPVEGPPPTEVVVLVRRGADDFHYILAELMVAAGDDARGDDARGDTDATEA